VISLILLSALSAILYRLGGWGHGFNTKVRDMGVPTCMILYMSLAGHWHWILIVCWGLMFGAQTTYFKKKGSDAKWFNWLFVGLAFSFSMAPYLFISGNITGFVLRCVIVTVFTVAWSEFIGKAWIEESGRGFIQIIALPLLT